MSYSVLDLRTYRSIWNVVLLFTDCIVSLFGRTIPNWTSGFFKDAGRCVIVMAVVAFALAWLMRARPHSRPKSYNVVSFDVFGRPEKLDGIRTEFKTHDVAWSFMKQYKETYPLYNFALVSSDKAGDRQTIFKYI